MVPIIDTEVQFEPLCVFNGAKMSNHPYWFGDCGIPAAWR